MDTLASEAAWESPIFTSNVNGRHLQAYYMQRRIYDTCMRILRNANRALNLLDYGCGEDGVSRSIYGSLMTEGDKLDLFDKLPISQPRSPQTRIVTQEDIFGLRREEYDMITLSYVLCLNEHEESVALLNELRQAQRKALFVAVDYTLNGRTRDEVDTMLTANQERIWKEALGDDEWYRTHMRFTRESFSQLFKESGFNVCRADCFPLDGAGYRGYVLAKGAGHQTTKLTILPGT